LAPVFGEAGICIITLSQKVPVLVKRGSENRYHHGATQLASVRAAQENASSLGFFSQYIRDSIHDTRKSRRKRIQPALGSVETEAQDMGTCIWLSAVDNKCIRGTITFRKHVRRWTCLDIDRSAFNLDGGIMTRQPSHLAHLFALCLYDIAYQLYALVSLQLGCHQLALMSPKQSGCKSMRPCFVIIAGTLDVRRMHGMKCGRRQTRRNADQHDMVLNI